MVPMSTSAKELDSVWKILRFSLRHAAHEHSERNLTRVNALSGQPVDPEQVSELVRQIDADLEKEAGGDEASPVMRALKSRFRPSSADKERKQLKKAFNDYLKAWQGRRS